jgi:hypothetical protein
MKEAVGGFNGDVVIKHVNMNPLVKRYEEGRVGVHQLPPPPLHTAMTQYQKFETNIPRKETARSQSLFPNSCVCERFIYSHDCSAYSTTGKYMDRSLEYKNRSQTHECGNGLRPRNYFSGNT